MLLKQQVTPHHKIARITGVSENTVRAALQSYNDGGIELLTTVNFRKPSSKLKPFDAEIKEHLENNPVTTINQACKEIETLTGLSLKNTQMRTYLNELGVRRRKVNSIPAKVDLDAQKKYHDESLQPRLDEAKKGTRTVYFVDAAHFVLGAFWGTCGALLVFLLGRLVDGNDLTF